MSLSPKYNEDEEHLRDDDIFFDENRFLARFTSDEVDERFLQVIEKETAVEEYEKNVEDRENRVKNMYNVYLLKSALLKIKYNAFTYDKKIFMQQVSLNRVIKNLEERNNNNNILKNSFMILKMNLFHNKKEKEITERNIKVSNRERIVKNGFNTIEKMKKTCYVCIGLNILCFLYNITK